MFESFDTIYYTAVYLLPGFLIKGIIDTCNPTEQKDVGEKVFSWLALSLLSICCCDWVIPIVYISKKTWLMVLVIITFANAADCLLPWGMSCEMQAKTTS